MIRSLLLAGAGIVAALSASSAGADPRVATRLYRQGEIVVLRGGGDTQSTIAFAPDEHIENVAVGDSAGWQVTPNKRADLLFVKPMKPGARSNMTVVTDQRTYLFDLVSAPRAAAVYMLSFTYPAPPPGAVPAASTPAPPAPGATAELADAASVRASVAAASAPDPTMLRFGWATRGDKALLPARLFDDGTSTYLAWPVDATLPAILARQPDGDEGPVNYTVRGEFVVVDGIPAQLVLRAGKQVATLTPPVTRTADAGGARSRSRAERPSRTRSGPLAANLARPGF